MSNVIKYIHIYVPAYNTRRSVNRIPILFHCKSVKRFFTNENPYYVGALKWEGEGRNLLFYIPIDEEIILFFINTFSHFRQTEKSK